jgi:hypothetical protein
MSLIIGKALSAEAKQVVLEYKVFGVREGILDAASGTGSSLADITAAVLAVAKNYDPVLNPTPYITVTDGSQKGVYVGAVGDSASPFKVLIRAHGTDNGVEDGLGDEIYGVLSEALDVVSLAFKKSDGTAHTFAASIQLDIFFVEFCDLYQADPAALLLTGGISGVVDLNASLKLAELEASDTLIATAAQELIAAEADIRTAQVGHLVALSGVAADAEDLGAFSGTTIPDDSTIKEALQSLETVVESVSAGTPKPQLITLTASDESNKYFDLASAPTIPGATILFPLGQLPQAYSVDFNLIEGATPGENNRVSWTGLGMDLLGLVEGDQIQVIYF